MPDEQTHDHPLRVLLDLIDCPVLLFDDAGSLVFANRAARALPCHAALAPLLAADPRVRPMVRGIARGQPGPETRLCLEVPCADRVMPLECACSPKPVDGLVAMSVCLADRGEPTQILELMRAELMPPILDALHQTRQLAGSAPQLRGSLQRLTERLDHTADLLDALGEEIPMADDCMPVHDMVRSCCQELANRAASLGVTLVLRDGLATAAPVCGSRRLLQRAVSECIHHAMAHARAEAPGHEPVGVEIGWRASAQHLLLDIGDMGLLSPEALRQHAACVFRPDPPADGRTGTVPPPMPRPGLPLARRVLQLHGGLLRIAQDGDGGLRMMLEMPTATPSGSRQPAGAGLSRAGTTPEGR